MVTCRFGGVDGFELELEDPQDLVVVRTRRRGARHDVSPLGRSSRQAMDRLEPLFGFAAAGVGVYRAPAGGSEELASVVDADPEVQFAGRGLRDQFGEPVVYTENAFVKFVDDVSQEHGEEVVRAAGLTVKRTLDYAPNAYFVGAPERTGRRVFAMVDRLLERDDVELCHPELVRELVPRAVAPSGAFPQEWHLHTTEIGGQPIEEHANVVPAWERTRGEGMVIAVIDDGVDIEHVELSGPDKIVAPRSVGHPRSDDPRPGDGDNHGTACSGVACAQGRDGATGVAPAARLMPVRFVSALGSQDEADAFVWAADHGADVISCSWGPPDGRWWDPDDPRHDAVVPLPDSTRLAIDHAVSTGRGGLGCVITWAAGNGNEPVDNDGYASYEKVIAVAACNDVGRKSAYSDVGEAIWCCFPSSHGLPSRTPGIWTTDRSGHEGYNPGDPTQGDASGDYTNSFGGTSSSCPGVAGVVALMLSVAPGLRWDEVKDLLRRSCDRIDDGPGEYDQHGHSRNYGYGRVNTHLAVLQAAGEASGETPEAGGETPAAPDETPPPAGPTC
jgi:subtilisin family serine protease